jgi:hypothetical protein
MNASQLLEVPTEIFVNQDQEDKWEADRKRKRKVDLLAVALAKLSVGPGMQAMAEEEAIPVDSSQCPWNGFTLE